MELIQKYFPHLSDTQIRQFAALGELYTDWNAKINVISRKDIDNLYAHHVLHSLGIAKMIQFRPGTRVMDVGTGGGFPGIPLAILMPDVSFFLVDSVGKKIKVATEIARAVELRNVTTAQQRVETVKAQFDFVVSRAVMNLPDLVQLVRKNIAKPSHNSMPNGLLCLKGGDMSAETAPFKHHVDTMELSDVFKEPYFETKKVVYVSIL